MTVGNPYDRLRELLPSDEELGIEGYEVLAPLGEGGFGRVYLARQPAFDRDVAIKLIAATGIKEDIARRFERECRAVGTLSGHPNIVTLYDCGVTRWGRPYIVMEHMAGGSLAQRLNDAGPMEWAEAVDHTIEIASALETAHRAGILHRDIKPENLLLSTYGEPKLADFGVASIPGGYQTHTGAVTASLAHAAPEVLEGGRATRAVDVYSLGSTLFTLVSGAPAFSGEDDSGLQALIARTLTQPVPDLRNEGLPSDLCDVIERAMAKDPTDRFTSAYEMALALREVQTAAGAVPTDIAVAEASAVVYATDASTGPDDRSATRIRARRELTPPTVESSSRSFKWRTPVIAAAVVLLLTAGTGGAIVMNARRTTPPEAAAAPAGVAEVTDAKPPTGEADPSDAKSAPRSEGKPAAGRNKGRVRDGGHLALGGPSGSSGYSVGGYGTGDAQGDAAPVTSSGGSAPSGDDQSTGGSGESRPEPKPEEPPLGHETRATIVLYHHWSDSGEYFFTANRDESEDALLIYDHRHSEGYVWATSRPGDGLIPICYSNERGCYGFASKDRPTSGQYRTLYWYPGARYGHYYSTDPNETYRGQPLSVFGYIRGGSI